MSALHIQLKHKHCQPLKEEAFHFKSASSGRPGPACLTHGQHPGSRAEPGIPDKATLQHSAALGFWPISFLPAWLPLGMDISKLHISSSQAIKCWPGAQRGSPERKGPGPVATAAEAGRLKGTRHEGGAAGLQPRCGAWAWLQLFQKRQQEGGSGFLPPTPAPSPSTSRFSEGVLVTLSHPPGGGK